MGACAVAEARGRLGLRRHRHGRHQLRGVPDQGAARRGFAASGTGSTATSSACRWSTCTRSAPAAARSPYVQAGALHVGPESAKADPGPICYGRGGTQPDGDRRQPRARLPQPRGVLRRRVQAHDPGRARGDPRADREAARPRRGRGGLRHLPDREREHGERDPPRLVRGAASTRATSAWSCTAATARCTPACRPTSSASASCWCRRPRRPSPRSGLLLADYVVDTQRSYITPVGPRAGGPHQRAVRRDGGARRARAASRRALARRPRLPPLREPLLSGPDLRHGGARRLPRGRPHGARGARAHGRGVPRSARGAARLRGARRGARDPRRARADDRPDREAEPARVPARRHAHRAARCARGGRPSSAGASRTRPSTTARRSGTATASRGRRSSRSASRRS